MSKINSEYLIIGGGILGSAVAYSLSKRLESISSNAQVAVIDLDLEGEFSSTLKMRAVFVQHGEIEQISNFVFIQ